LRFGSFAFYTLSPEYRGEGTGATNSLNEGWVEIAWSRVREKEERKQYVEYDQDFSLRAFPASLQA
jgi:hypothetical protein